jgi:tetratricopeptide (TPR) repeat protein
MNLLQGIQLPELIMLILGFILGLALIFIFIYTALKSKPNLYLLFGFIVPTLLIGYPSYKSSQFGKNVEKLEVLVENVNKNPTDVSAQKALIENLEQLPASRCRKSVDAMTTIANAQASLGQYDSANVTIKKAIELDNTSTKALESQRQIQQKWQARRDIRERVKYIDILIKDFEKRPNDKILRDSIVIQLNNVAKLSMASVDPIRLENEQVITVATAAAIIGRTEQSSQIADEVLKISPNQKEAVKLKKDIENKKYQAQQGQTRTKPKPRPKDNKPSTQARQDEKRDTVPSPVAVFQDTSLKLRLVPKGIAGFKKWNIKE